jgi:Na+/proline symporter
MNDFISSAAAGGVAAAPDSLGQAFFMAVLLGMFCTGVWVRPALDSETPPMTARQFTATAIAGFVLMCLPLSVPLYDAAVQRSDLLGLFAALVPVFFAGLTARSELGRRLGGQPAAALPAE